MLSVLDWIVIAVYLIGMVTMSYFLGRRQKSKDDYYVGSRSLPWWAIGLSVMATQTSAISFISIPAFVGLRKGGGAIWLQYELAVPLAMILVMVFLIPFFRRLELVSVYEFLELRFGRASRLLLSAVFLISRSLGTGVGVYASAIVLAVCLSVPTGVAIVVIGLVTALYDAVGGITAVVYSDVIQLFILIGGLVLCIVLCLADVGGFAQMWSDMKPRFAALDPHAGFADGSQIPLWAFLIGGLVLYVSYYGTDQSQVQRQLSSKSLHDAKKSLLLNGLARFPLTCLYVFLGLCAGSYCVQHPEFRARIPLKHPDFMVPKFVLQNCPIGIKGVIFAAILAAAMSSLDSALNSLSAATMQDFLEPLIAGKANVGKRSERTRQIFERMQSGVRAEEADAEAVKRADGDALLGASPSAPPRASPVDESDAALPPAQPAVAKSDRRVLIASKIVTFLWGAAITGFAFLVGGISNTVVEGINKIGSCFYGPILAGFLLGILTRRIGQPDLFAGILSGVGVNLVVWIAFDKKVCWMWWNVFGLVVSWGVAALTCLIRSCLTHRRRARAEAAGRLPEPPESPTGAKQDADGSVNADEARWLEEGRQPATQAPGGTGQFLREFLREYAGCNWMFVVLLVYFALMIAVTLALTLVSHYA